MQLMRRKGFAALYWIVAFVATVLAIVFGARIGNGGAPEFGDSTTGASASSHLIFAVVGAAVGGLIALALFAGVWIAMWAADRRAHGSLDDDDSYGGVDALNDMDDDADEEASRDLVQES